MDSSPEQINHILTKSEVSELHTQHFTSTSGRLVDHSYGAARTRLLKTPLQVLDVSAPLDAILPDGYDVLKQSVARKLGISPEDIAWAEVLKKELRFEDKKDIHFNLAVKVMISTEEASNTLLARQKATSNKSPVIPDTSRSFSNAGQAEFMPGVTFYVLDKKDPIPVIPPVFLKEDQNPVILGAGISGLFAALFLSESGLNPIVLDVGSQTSFPIVLKVIPNDTLNEYFFVKLTELGLGNSILSEETPLLDENAWLTLRKKLWGKITLSGGSIIEDVRFTEIAFSQTDGITISWESSKSPGTAKTTTSQHMIFTPEYVPEYVAALLENAGVKLEQEATEIGVTLNLSEESAKKHLFGKFARHQALPATIPDMVRKLPNGHIFCLRNPEPNIFTFTTRISPDEFPLELVRTWADYKNDLRLAFESMSDKKFSPDSLSEHYQQKHYPLIDEFFEAADSFDCHDYDAFISQGVVTKAIVPLKSPLHVKLDAQTKRVTLENPQPAINLYAGGSAVDCYHHHSLRTLHALHAACNLVDHMCLLRPSWLKPFLSRSIPLSPAVSPAEYSKTYSDAWGTYKYELLPSGGARLLSCHPTHTELVMPSFIEEHPVYEISDKIFSYCTSVTELELPAALSHLGYNIFSAVPFLQRLVMPSGLKSFDVRSLNYLRNLKELQLPDLLDAIPPNLFASCRPASLVIGINTRFVEAGAFSQTRLQKVSVHAKNPWLYSDGQALYTKDMTALIALAVDAESYRVLDTCTSISEKAFFSLKHLHNIQMPDRVTTIGKAAFAQSGLQSFHAPAHLNAIENQAFSHCARLTTMELCEGIQRIGAEAFIGTDIRALHLPSTLISLDVSFIEGSHLVDGISRPLITINPRCKTFFMDDFQALYKRTESGVVLLKFLDDDARSFTLNENTTEIAAHAFAWRGRLELVEASAALRKIGEEAFLGCVRLRYLDGYDHLERIEGGAFLNTALQEFMIPETLQYAAPDAFVIKGAGQRRIPEVVPFISAHPKNKVFFVENDFLCSNQDYPYVTALIYLGKSSEAVIPQSVSIMGPYCLCKTRNLKRLIIHDGIQLYSRDSTRCSSVIESITLLCNSPYSVRPSYTFHFPGDRINRDALRRALELSAPIDIPAFYTSSDAAMATSNNIKSRATFSIDRLLDPLYLTDSYRDDMITFLADNFEEIVLDFGTTGNISGIQDLIALGFINETNITDVIDILSRGRSAEASGYLLEVRHKQFRYSTVSEFDL